jgi:N-acetylmuramoyl-L-alanine amidase
MGSEEYMLMQGYKSKQSRAFLFFAFLAMPFVFSSCATPVKPPSVIISPPGPVIVQPPQQVIPRQDVFHIVAPGETLWRIGKMYDVAPKDIARANSLSMKPLLKKGMRLSVPNAAPIQPVISLYPSKQWTHIIIHHSATDEGDGLLFDKAHSHKGWGGVGYHFVIDNGTKGRVDGQVEVLPRWLKQISGAHCKADHMNERAIGICLVGNFNDERPSSRQMDALVDLVQKLKEYYRIPVSHIKGHGQVRGAKTDCPGKRFPWKSFMRTIE